MGLGSEEERGQRGLCMPGRAQGHRTGAIQRGQQTHWEPRAPGDQGQVVPSAALFSPLRNTADESRPQPLS